MTFRTRVTLVMGLMALFLTPDRAVSGEKRHTVKPGESASSIAGRYYGDIALGGRLLQFNGRSSTVIRPGETLRIPFAEVHTVRAGDSWSGIASHYMKRPSAYPALAALNGLEPGAALQLGQQIRIPVVLRHTLQKGETAAGVAERYYGDSTRAALLMGFNDIADARRLSIGQQLEIPDLTLRVRSPAGADPTTHPSTASKDAPAPLPAPMQPPRPVFTSELRQASKLLRTADFEHARSLLESLNTSIESDGTNHDLRLFYSLLTEIYVALDLQQQACRIEQRRTRLIPEDILDPVQVSPKIRAAVAGCSNPAS